MNNMLQQGPGSSRGTGSSKSRAPMFTDAAGGRLSERMGACPSLSRVAQHSSELLILQAEVHDTRILTDCC